MRTLLKISMDVEASNQAVKEGTMQKTMQSLNDLIHPEAAYFTAEQGKRTGYFVFDMTDSSQLPKIAEPLFRVLKAEINVSPVMNPEELKKGLESLDLNPR